MPSAAVTSVNDGVTVSPPCTAAPRVTVKVMSLPSDALALFTVTTAPSSLLMVPVPVSIAVTLSEVPETLRSTVKVSLPSTTASSSVETVKVLVSLAVPVKESAVVFSS